jgi:hypothetical protein
MQQQKKWDGTLKVAIVSAWTNPGGSTIALSNLCNAFNNNGVDCTFYGPHAWHLSRCKSGLFANFDIDNFDGVLIYHFLNLLKRPPNIKKLILNCHETNLYPIKEHNKVWDEIVFVSNFQKDWHKSDGVVIPNVITKLQRFPINQKKPVGVIGSIDSHKNPHIAIIKAIENKHKVLLYGRVTDEKYYKNEIIPLLKSYEGSKLKYMGYEDNHQKMYQSISRVYSASPRETFNLVKAECLSIGMQYYGFDTFNGLEPEYGLTEQQIIEKWQAVISL